MEERIYPDGAAFLRVAYQIHSIESWYRIGMHSSLARLMRVASSHTRVFVGPPDAVSRLRPIVYDGIAGSVSRPTSDSHPYSLSEFSAPIITKKRGAISSYAERVMSQLETLQLHTRLQTIWLDQFNHRFWTDNNARFERAESDYKSRLALPGPVPLELMSPFYREWLRVNSVRLRNYNRVLWTTTYKVIFAQIRLSLFSYYTRAILWLAGGL